MRRSCVRHSLTPFVKIWAATPWSNTPQRLSASEDFALFAQQIPSVYLTIGTGEAKDGFCYGNHHPSVRYDESALSIGAAAYAICAQALLENRSAEKKAI